MADKEDRIDALSWTRPKPKPNGRWFAIAMFLAGTLLAGLGGVLRGDWIGKEAAIEVKLELKEDTIQMEGRLEKRLDKIERKLDRVLEMTR